MNSERGIRGQGNDGNKAIITNVYLSTDGNECASLPCQNNGTCAELVGGYICNCSAGFNGTNCEIGESAKTRARKMSMSWGGEGGCRGEEGGEEG